MKNKTDFLLLLETKKKRYESEERSVALPELERRSARMPLPLLHDRHRDSLDSIQHYLRTNPAGEGSDKSYTLSYRQMEEFNQIRRKNSNKQASAHRYVQDTRSTTHSPQSQRSNPSYSLSPAHAQDPPFEIPVAEHSGFHPDYEQKMKRRQARNQQHRHQHYHNPGHYHHQHQQQRSQHRQGGRRGNRPSSRRSHGSMNRHAAMQQPQQQQYPGQQLRQQRYPGQQHPHALQMQQAAQILQQQQMEYQRHFQSQRGRRGGKNKNRRRMQNRTRDPSRTAAEVNGNIMSRIRIHGDNWADSSNGFVGLVGKGGTKIGLYSMENIDPLLPINNRIKKDPATSISSSSFNTHHAAAFWRLFGVEMNNVIDFRQTVGDSLIGFAVRPDGCVVVKAVPFKANAAVNIVKILDILEDMRANGYRSRTVDELTTEGTIQAIVEQWINGSKVIEMKL